MINRILTTIFGSQHERDVKKMRPTVAAINEMEPQIKALSDEALRAKTEEFRREQAAWRTLGMRPFDVQLMGGMVLHNGRISEMRTGEGKTLTATLPVYLNALE